MPEFKYAGSISHGTMRDADLIPVFLGVLKDLEPTLHNRIMGSWDWSQYMDWEAFADNNPEDASNFTNELFSKLEELAPEGYYFGASEGDGSEYGFWEVES